MEEPDGRSSLSGKDLDTVRLANRITTNTFDVMRFLHKKGVAVSVENPHGSLMWHCKAFARFQKEPPARGHALHATRSCTHTHTHSD